MNQLLCNDMTALSQAQTDQILRIAELANGLAAQMGAGRLEASRHISYEPLLLAAAAREYEERGLRAQCGFGDVVGEPGWDMMLDFYIQHHRGARISVTSAIIAGRGAATTNLRYIKVLEEKGWIMRSPDTADARRDWLSLTDAGFALMQAYLEKKCGVLSAKTSRAPHSKTPAHKLAA